MNKPKCYKCKYRGTIPGNAHSRCNYPGLDSDLFSMFTGAVKNIPIAVQLNVRGIPHGISSGWFNWPCDFDPVWLESCDGFEEK